MAAKISESTRLVLQDKIRKQLGNLVFRRVGKTHYSRNSFERGLHYEFDVSSFEARSKEVFRMDDLPENPELSKEWEVRCKRFSGVAKKAGFRGIRDTDKCPRVPISFNSGDYSELDITKTCSFEFNPRRRHKVLPQVGDLICGLVSGGSKPKFTRWFICSEQFLRMWTLLMYEDHDSFKGKTEARLRDFSMTGNKLCTNSFLKWMMALKDNRKQVSQEEADKRYWCLRTEYPSRQWVHVYCALVLLARWGELPCKFNIPSNRNTENNMKHWNLPGHFITTLLKLTSCKPSDIGCETWDEIERQARRRKTPVKTQLLNHSEYCSVKTPVKTSTKPVVYTILKKDFPTLGNPKKVPEAVWNVQKPATPDEVFSAMESGQSWADIMDAEEEENSTDDSTVELSNTEDSVELTDSVESEDSIEFEELGLANRVTLCMVQALLVGPPADSGGNPTERIDYIGRLLSRTNRSESDITNEEADEEVSNITSGRNSVNPSTESSVNTPSEGGDKTFVYSVYSQKGDNNPEEMILLSSKEKAEKYLFDWIEIQTNDGHIGGEQRLHSKLLKDCETCELRCYKAHKEGTLRDGTKGYIEEREVM